jgi:cytochrome c biogenesis protein CcdA
VSAALTVSFSAGALAAFNPCGFALLPGWAAVLVSGEGGGDDLFARLVRALRAGLVATIAFLLVFGVAGLVFGLGFAAFGRYLAFVGLAIGLVLACLGTLLLVDARAPGLNVGRDAARGTGKRASSASASPTRSGRSRAFCRCSCSRSGSPPASRSGRGSPASSGSRSGWEPCSR